MGKSLVIGATGLIGTPLVEHLASNGEDVIPTSSSGLHGYEYLNLSDFTSIRSCLQKVKPATIYIVGKVGGVDTTGELARQGNLQAPQFIARNFQKIQIVFFSSSYVFSGTGAAPNTVYDRPMPVNQYGMWKMMVEREVLAGPENVVVRTVGVFGKDRARKCYPYTVLGNLEKEGKVESYADQIMSPVLSTDVAEKTAEFVMSGGRGLIHVSGDTHISKWEWATDIATMFGYEESQVIPVTSSMRPQPEPRPVNASLRSTFKVTPYLESLQEFHALEK